MVTASTFRVGGRPVPARVFGIGVVCLLGLFGCAAPDSGSVETSQAAPPSSAVEPVPEAPSPSGPTIIFLGDSLTAGYGLDEDQAFPGLIGELLAEPNDGPKPRIVNAGVSGDTTAGGLSRLSWLLRQNPDVLVVALGANDGLRGLDVEASEENLRQIVLQAREAGARVLLAGMLMPPNYGPEYTEAFAAMYPTLSSELDVPLIPFLLEGVAGDPELNQPDGIHPTAEGQKILAETVLGHLRPVLAELGPRPADS